MHVAIIGSGPSGLYCADYLAKKADHCHIDIYDKAAEPFGLLRFGVAPDHHATKRLSIPFEKTLERDNIRFIGNVTIGKDLTAEQIHAHYDVVILAAGASEDRLLSLKVPKDIPYYPAGQLASWYNDSASHLTPKFGKNIVLFGQGNVAIDLARLLSKPSTTLLDAGLSPQVVEALTEHQEGRTIYIIGRGQTYDAKCTTDMLEELLALPDVSVTQVGGDLSGELPDSVLVEDVRVRTRNIQLFQSLPKTADANRRVHIEFRFNESPVLFGSNDSGAFVTVKSNAPVDGPKATENLPIETVLSAIGFLPKEVPGFGEASECELLDQPAKIYAVGWYAHGAKGVIQSNRVPSVAIAKEIIADPQHSIDSGKSGYHGIKPLLDPPHTS